MVALTNSGSVTGAGMEFAASGDSVTEAICPEPISGVAVLASFEEELQAIVPVRNKISTFFISKIIGKLRIQFVHHFFHAHPILLNQAKKKFYEHSVTAEDN